MRLVPRASTRIPSGASPKVRLFASPTTPARNLLERTKSSMGYLMEDEATLTIRLKPRSRVGQRLPYELDDAHQVRLEGTTPILVRDSVKRTGGRTSGVGDQDVQAPESLHRPLHERPDVVHPGQIGRVVVHLGPGSLAYLPDGLGERGFVAGGDHDLAPSAASPFAIALPRPLLEATTSATRPFSRQSREYEEGRKPYKRSLAAWKQERAKSKTAREANDKREEIVDREVDSPRLSLRGAPGPLA